MLQEQIAHRAKKLAGAHEIHKFLANGNDLLSRIQVQTKGNTKQQWALVVTF